MTLYSYGLLRRYGKRNGCIGSDGNMHDTIRQHFVPTFLLSSFASEKKPKNRDSKIKVYDKNKDQMWLASVDSIAYENKLYDVVIDLKKIVNHRSVIIDFIGKIGKIDNEKQLFKISIESQLAELESVVAPVIKKILQEENNQCLTDNERMILSIFLTVQFLRVPSNRSKVEKRLNVDRVRLLKRGFSKKYINSSEGKEALNGLLWINTILEIPNIAQDFYELNWNIIKRPMFCVDFVISDNPIYIYNDVLLQYGIKSKGTKTCLPLSKDIMLFLDNEMEEVGFPIYVSKEYVDKVNNGQYMQAKRFVYV